MPGVRGPISPWAREVGLHFAAADGMAPLEARAVTLGAGAVRHPVKLGGDPKTPRVAPTKRPGQSTLAGWLFVSALGGDPKTLGWLPRGPSARPSARGQLYPLTPSRLSYKIV